MDAETSSAGRGREAVSYPKAAARGPIRSKRLDPPLARVHDAAMDTAPPWFTGQLLLALLGIDDPRFEHSVIAMISHDEDGAMGMGVADPIGGMQVRAVLDPPDRTGRAAGRGKNGREG